MMSRMIVCFGVCVFAASVNAQALPGGGGGGPGGGSVASGQVTAISMSHAALGAGIFSLDADAGYSAQVSGDPMVNIHWDTWTMKSRLTIHSDSGSEYFRLHYTTDVKPGQTVTWSVDSFNGPTTATSGVYTASASIDGRPVGSMLWAAFDFDTDDTTIP